MQESHISCYPFKEPIAVARRLTTEYGIVYNIVVSEHKIDCMDTFCNF